MGKLVSLKAFEEVASKNDYEVFTPEEVASYYKEGLMKSISGQMELQEKESFVSDIMGLQKAVLSDENGKETIRYYRKNQVEWEVAEDGTILKGVEGVYLNTPENRRLNRVGEAYIASDDILKSIFEVDEDIVKAVRTGRYADTAENRRLHRVGQPYKARDKKVEEVENKGKNSSSREEVVKIKEEMEKKFDVNSAINELKQSISNVSSTQEKRKVFISGFKKKIDGLNSIYRKEREKYKGNKKAVIAIYDVDAKKDRAFIGEANKMMDKITKQAISEGLIPDGWKYTPSGNVRTKIEVPKENGGGSFEMTINTENGNEIRVTQTTSIGDEKKKKLSELEGKKFSSEKDAINAVEKIANEVKAMKAGKSESEKEEGWKSKINKEDIGKVVGKDNFGNEIKIGDRLYRSEYLRGGKWGSSIVRVSRKVGNDIKVVGEDYPTESSYSFSDKIITEENGKSYVNTELDGKKYKLEMDERDRSVTDPTTGKKYHTESDFFDELFENNRKSEKKSDGTQEEKYTRVKFDDLPDSGKVNLKKYLTPKRKSAVDSKLSDISKMDTSELKKMEKEAVAKFNKDFGESKKSQRAEDLYHIMKIKAELSKRK